MKKSEAIELLVPRVLSTQDRDDYAQALYNTERLIGAFLAIGFKPPCISHPLKVRALINTYIDPDFNIWDEDFEADPKLMAEYNRLQSILNKCTDLEVKDKITEDTTTIQRNQKHYRKQTNYT